MSPVADLHGDFCLELSAFLFQALKGKSLRVKVDIFRYLDADTINRFGNFKLGLDIDPFVERLKHFGASKNFIQRKLEEFSRTGTAQGVYAPDVFVVRQSDANDRFAIPLVVFEIVSTNSREDDLYFKTVFYETIGVQEYYIGEGRIRSGKILQAYQRVDKKFAKTAPRAEGFFSKTLGCQIPKKWTYAGE